MPKIVVVHNIMTPYKLPLFSAMARCYPEFEVVFLAESASNREWDIDTRDLRFSHRVLNYDDIDACSSIEISGQVWAALTELNPQTVIICGYDHLAYWSAAVWAKRHLKHLGLWFSNTRAIKSTHFVKEFLKRRLIAACQFAQVYSSRSKSYLESLGMPESDIDVVGNGSDNLFFKQEAEKWRPKRGTYRRGWRVRPHNFIFVGRFSAEKNIIALLEAYTRLSDFPNWGLILVGSGPLESKIRGYIRRHNITGVSLAGFVQKKQLGPYFAVSDVLVLPSAWETWGLVVNEAMASGLVPLVSSECGCVPDLVDQPDLIVNPKSVDELAQKMRQLAQSWPTIVPREMADRVAPFSFMAIGQRICEGWTRRLA